MSTTINSIHPFDGTTTRSGHFDLPDTCPICNHSIQPKHIYSLYNMNGDAVNYELVFHCTRRSCHRLFISYYIQDVRGSIIEFLGSKPKSFSGKDFGEDIFSLKEKLSTEFFDIYNEAEEAEQLGFNRICGGGYRKALEFLIKDYIKYINDYQEDVVSEIDNPKFTLGQAIAKYLLDDPTHTFSKISTWLGNDEVHYTKIHNKDVNFMKRG